ncbi:purine-cytosine permease family protein [Litchfieldia salsa]|uniref:Cytosine permease n=1 Tax=Litchfieldia salsa TaxID=930152 RepID=A0A1H0P4K6_9BACI|nr:cytosine permease [Litchfieldia salsa]SDO99668.1 cytosine permease [Litchfieldia salsa]
MSSDLESPTPIKNSAIETFGLEPVPVELRKTSWKEYFIIQAAFSVNSGNFLVPALAVLEGGLSFFAAIISTVIGAAIAFLFVSILSLPGANNGIPSQYAVRSMLGLYPARYFASPVRTITSLYWFAVQTIGGTYVLIGILESHFEIRLPFLPVSIMFAIIMSILALIGFNAVKKATKLFLPFLLLGQLTILYLYLSSNKHSLTQINEQGSWNTGTMCFFASLAFVQYISGVSSSSDMTRYASSSTHAFWGLYSGNLIGFMMTSILGAFAATYSNEWNPFITSTQLTNSTPVVILILTCALVSMLSINLSNAYTGGYSLLNIFPKLGRVRSAISFGGTAILLSAFPAFVEEAKQFISLLGAFIIPLSAVLVIDFILIKKRQLTSEDLGGLLNHSYLYNKRAMICIVIGVLLYLIIPEQQSPGFLAFIITGCCYLGISIHPLKHHS